MQNTMEPVEYGKLACDSVMNMYSPQDLPPKGVLFYHQGVFLLGMQNIYKLCGERKYFKYVKDYCDSVLGPNGELFGFCHEMSTADTPGLARHSLEMLDGKQATLLLYQLYDETGEEKYVNAIRECAQSIHYWPVNDYGGYWHMMNQYHQMWLDGAYMVGPISVLYVKRFGDTILRERAIKQIFIMNEHMRDEKTGLYFHGWDPTKAAAWADKKTGLSSQIWGRAVGWYAVAILDIIENIPVLHKDIPKLKEIEINLLRALAGFQGEDGMWYEVLDKPGKADNWIESSCTFLFAYSYAKAIRLGIADDEEFSGVLERAYAACIEHLYFDEGNNLVVDNVCEGTCINDGTYEHYISRRKVKNDLHGVGAFLLMCAEMQRYYNGKCSSSTVEAMK